MPIDRLAILLGAGIVVSPATLAAQRQTSADEYTRYELLAPGSSQFKITYDVTATTPGATRLFNPIRKGSVASDESVWDPASRRAPQATGVSGADAVSYVVRGRKLP